MKLLNQENLAQLAQALNAKMKTAVAGEEERAMAAESDLQSAINQINDFLDKITLLNDKAQWL